MITPFKDRLLSVNPEYETFSRLQTLQINLGSLCNLHCSHCHVDASPRRNEIMERSTMEHIATFLAQHPGLTLDITGGCPEMNPDFRFLIEKTAGLAARRLLRSNLTIMIEPGWEWLPQFCREQQLTVIGSLPCYLEENVDRQRGEGAYHNSIAALKALNAIGYGTELELDLVYNPGGNYIPGSQSALEAAYKDELSQRHGIVFNNLYTITNAPVGRFLTLLEADNSYASYLQLLADRFNPATAATIMCRSLISVNWQGRIYNCDFNQAMAMPLVSSNGSELMIADLCADDLCGSPILLAQHCYSCTAGEGSSCTGALTGQA